MTMTPARYNFFVRQLRYRPSDKQRDHLDALLAEVDAQLASRVAAIPGNGLQVMIEAPGDWSGGDNARVAKMQRAAEAATTYLSHIGAL